jgi:hypothetical protein
MPENGRWDLIRRLKVKSVNSEIFKSQSKTCYTLTTLLRF